MKWQLLGTLVLGFILGLATLFLASQPAAQAQPKPARVEYKVYSTRGKPADDITIEINRDFAAHGWEFVAMLEQVKDGAFLLFRKEKK